LNVLQLICMAVAVRERRQGSECNDAVSFPWYALHCAARTGDDDRVRELLISGHAINPLDEQNRTPLCVAVENNRLTTARILVNNGGKVNLPDMAPHTILFAAVKYGSIEMA
jgi:ankyrin repeat protein